PKWVIGRKHLADLGDKWEEDVRPRDGVVRERAGEQLSAFAVVDTVLLQRLPDALCDPAVGLAMQYARIDGPAHVVDGGVADDLDRPKFEVDFDFADVTAIGEAADPDGLIAFGGQRPGQIAGEIVAAHRLACHVEYPDGAIGPLHGEIAAREFDVVLGGFEHVGGNSLALGDQRIRRFADDDAG